MLLNAFNIITQSSSQHVGRLTISGHFLEPANWADGFSAACPGVIQNDSKTSCHFLPSLPGTFALDVGIVSSIKEPRETVS